MRLQTMEHLRGLYEKPWLGEKHLNMCSLGATQLHIVLHAGCQSVNSQRVMWVILFARQELLQTFKDKADGLQRCHLNSM